MITLSDDERIERQLYAAYRLILSWPKREVQTETRPAVTLADDADRVSSITTTPERSGDTARKDIPQ